MNELSEMSSHDGDESDKHVSMTNIVYTHAFVDTRAFVETHA